MEGHKKLEFQYLDNFPKTEWSYWLFVQKNQRSKNYLFQIIDRRLLTGDLIAL